MRFEPAGYDFDDPDLLRQALTHRSAGNRNNERLEFLGDSILNFIIADEVFKRFGDATEGDLSRLRSRLVRKETLAQVAKERELGDHVRLGAGELRSGGHRRSSILADAVEAIIGAVFLDGGFEAARAVVVDWFTPRITSLPPAESLKDAKTRLQEYLQARRHELPSYDLLRTEGADHQRTFHIRCTISALNIAAEASGSSRRKAEQAAASRALESLQAGRESR